MCQEKITINNVDDLYKIEREKREYFHIVDSELYKNSLTLFFRGQADYSWELKPSIMRQEGLHEWEELIDYDPNIENLLTYIAKCQHYGKKTRFLDFSTDINVALFFACNQDNDKDGSLFICPYVPRKMVWIDSFIISELSLLKEEISLKDFSENLMKKYTTFKSHYEDITELCTYIVSWLNHGFVVLPDKDEYEKMKEYNKRIYNQKGAFFVCGNRTKKPLDSWSRISSHAGDNVIIPEINDVPDTIQSSRFVTNIKIPSELKSSILDSLNKKGINEDYLYNCKRTG